MVFGPDTNSILQEMATRLDGIYRLIELQTRPQLEAAIQKLATTKERRKIWILSDGQRKTDEISRLGGSALRTVQVFVQEADRSNLMDTSRRGYPRRRFDVIPLNWVTEIEEVQAALGLSPPTGD